VSVFPGGEALSAAPTSGAGIAFAQAGGLVLHSSGMLLYRIC